MVTFTEEILNGKLHFLCNDNEVAVYQEACYFIVLVRDHLQILFLPLSEFKRIN